MAGRVGPHGLDAARTSSAVRMSAKSTVWNPAPIARSDSQTRGSWSSLIIELMPYSSRRSHPVLELVQVVRRVLAGELDVVEVAGVTHDLDDRRPHV